MELIFLTNQTAFHHFYRFQTNRRFLHVGVRQGHNIWFCQVCANRTCRQCGSPTQRPQGCDLLDENVHVAILGAPSGCVNVECTKHFIAYSRI